jgi:hypothetical protein
MFGSLILPNNLIQVGNGIPVESAMGKSDQLRIVGECSHIPRLWIIKSIRFARLIIGIMGRFRVKANFFYAELQHDIADLLFSDKSTFHLMYGLDYRDYIIVPDGNYFINPSHSGKNLNY